MNLSASIGSAESFAEQTSLFRSLTGSLGIAGTETKGLATSLSAALGSTSSLAEQTMFVKSLADSLSSSSSLGEQFSLVRTLGDSLTMNSRLGKGSAEVLRSNLTGKTVLSGRYDCHETIVGNCGTASGSFAYLVVALGAIAFAVYAIRLRRQAPSLPGELKPENVVVDKEGWETKSTDGKKPKRKKSSNDKVDREQKSDG